MTEKGIKKPQASIGNTMHQLAIAATLISVLPILSLIYVSMSSVLHVAPLPLHDRELLLASIILMVSAGVVLLMSHTHSIISLREYVTAATHDALFKGESNSLISENLHDIEYIENCLNASLTELQQRMSMLEQARRAGQKLEQKVKEQQALINRMHDVCHQTQQPASILKQRLTLLTKMDATLEQRVQVAECRKEIDDVLRILSGLKEVGEPHDIQSVAASAPSSTVDSTSV